MEVIRVTSENLEKEHICCAISNNRDCQVVSKKAWLSERMKEGLVFLKANARGKCFIEYIPAEFAWAPVEAPGYMYIDCFWVSGQMKGKGYSSILLEECIRDSKEKGKLGIVIVSSPKKLAYLSDKKYLLHKGFQVADIREPYFELLYLPFKEQPPVPKFRQQTGKTTDDGFVVYYTHQCPFTAKYVPLLEEYAAEKGLPFQSILIDSREKAQNAEIPFTSFSLFYKGNFVTHEILSVKKFEALTQKLLSQESTF